MNPRLITLATLAVTLAACSTVQERNTALDQARGKFNQAQGDAQVATLAPEELKRASESLAVAQQAWTDKAPNAKVDHLAYLSSQRVTIAQETASSRAYQAVTSGAAVERDKMMLAMRTNEADVARQQLAASQQSNALKKAELEQADALALRDRARLERSNARASDLEAQLKDLNAKQTDRGMVVTLGDVLFDSGQSRLLPDSERNMAKLADVFKLNPERKAAIEGYTDSVGGSSANLDLSARRASAVMTALVNLGVPADRLMTHGYGEDKPSASNGTAAGRQMNRRVEIVFAAP